MEDSDSEEKDTDSEEPSKKKKNKKKRVVSKKDKKSSSKGKRKRVAVSDSQDSSNDGEPVKKARKKSKKSKGAKKRMAVSDSSSDEEDADVRRNAKKLKGGMDPDYAPSKPAYELDELTSSVDPSALLLDTQQVSSALFGMMGVNEKSAGDSVSCLLLGGATADPKLKRKIWDGSFVELGSLAPRTELRPHMFVDQGKNAHQLSLA